MSVKPGSAEMPAADILTLIEPVSRKSWKLSGDSTTIGRDERSSIFIDHPSVSWSHAVLRIKDGKLTIEDQASSNGTEINGQEIQPRKEHPIAPGDSLRLGSVLLEIERRESKLRGTEVIKTNSRVQLIGRDPNSDVALGSPQVSWHHCRLTPATDGFVIQDLGSTNGTFLNGSRIDKAPFGAGDVLKVGPHRLRVEAGQLREETIRGYRIDGLSLSRFTAAGTTILNGVEVSILPQQLVGIVGPSGSGKSTLLKALSGMAPGHEGAVYLNGESLYEQLDEMKSLLGYVPQDDIIPLDLTVNRVLWHAGRLRLPNDTTSDEIHELVDTTLRELGLSHRSSSIVRTLSGGERKRVNVAVELLTKPGILFLDEPTTGLDPGMERQVFLLLRRLCDSGRTIVLATHAAESIARCDRILFLGPGGNLVFYGTPPEALDYFGVSEFAEIYDRISGHGGAALKLAKTFRASPMYAENVKGPLASLRLEHKNSAGAVRGPRRQLVRQWFLLVKRQIETMLADQKNLALLIGQAPLIGLLLLVLFHGNIFSKPQEIGASGSFPIEHAPKLLFVLVLSAIWCGTCCSAREIVKERSMYLRERLVNLEIGPYVLSKVFVLAIVCLLQVALLILVVFAGIPLSGGFDEFLRVVTWLFAASWTGMLLGLCVSAIASTGDQAVSSLPILLIPQVLLGGLIIPLDQMGAFGKSLAGISISRWSLGALCRTLDLAGRYETLGLAKAAIPKIFETSIQSAWTGFASLAFVLIATCGVALRLKEAKS